MTPPDPGASAGSAGSGGTSGGGGAGANGGNAPTSGSSGAGGDAGASGDAGAAGDAGAGGDAGASGDAGAGGDTGAAGDAGAGGDAGAAGDAGAGGDAGAAGAGAGGAGSGGAGGTVDVPDCPDVLPAVSPPLFCPPGEVLCNGACEPGESDTNCGECGVVCAAGETCSNGFCRVPAKEITFSTSSYDAADAFYRGMAADDGFNVYTVNDGYFAAPYTIVAAGGPGIAFAISGGALYRTKDKGVTWTALDGVLPAKKLSVDRRRKLLIAELQDGSRVGYASWGDGPPNPLPWPWSPGMDAASGAMWSAAKEGTTWSTFYSTNGTDVCRAGKGFTKNPLGELDSLGFGGISNGVAAQVECTSTLTSLRDPSVVTTAPPKSLFVDPSTVCKVGGMMKAGWARPDRFEAFVSSRDPQFYSCYSMRWVSREWVAGTAEWSPVPTVAPQLGGSVKTYGDALLFNTTHIRSITADGRALAALGWRACGPGGSDKPELYEVRANVLE